MYEELKKLVEQKNSLQSQIENQMKKDIEFGDEILIEKNGHPVTVEVLGHSYNMGLFVVNPSTGKKYNITLFDVLNAN